MKKIHSILLLLTMTAVSLQIGAQEITINFKDGFKQEFNMNDIENIEYSDSTNTELFSAYLSKAGMLSSLLSKSDAKEILKLKLSGHMDARDFEYIKWNFTRIQVIDLSDVVIDAYSGDDGPNEGNDDIYVANEIPAGAFFFWSTSKKHHYTGMPKNEGMSSLTKIILPKGVKSIGRKAFANMLRLENITIMTANPPKVHDSCFMKLPREAKLYVPKGSKSHYRSAEGWNEFKDIIEVNANGDPILTDSPLVGTWKTIRLEGWGEAIDSVGIDYLQLKADSTYIQIEEEGGVPIITRGTWTTSGNEFTLHKIDRGKTGFSFQYKIIEIKSNRMKVSMWRVIAYMEKEQDNVIIKYLRNKRYN